MFPCVIFFFFHNTHICCFFLCHKNLSWWEKNQAFPINLFTFWGFFHQMFCRENISFFFLPLFRNTFLLYLTITFYLLYLSVFIVSLPSATEKPNPMILLLVLSQTLLLTSQLQLIYHSELCRNLLSRGTSPRLLPKAARVCCVPDDQEGIETRM